MSKDAGLALRNSSEESSSVITSFVRMCCFKKEKSFDRMTLAKCTFSARYARRSHNRLNCVWYAAPALLVLGLLSLSTSTFS